MRRTKNSILMVLAMTVVVSSKVLAGELKTVRYSKEDLQKAADNSFIKSSDLSDLLATKLKILAVTVTKRQGGSNQSTFNVAASAREISKERQLKRLGILAFDPESPNPRGDTDQLRITLSHQTRKAVEVKFKEAFPIFEQIKNGLVFKLDVLKPETLITRSKEVPVIRYGLVETDILPSDRNIPMASLGGISDTDASFSRPAQVIYTIDRINNEENKKVFDDAPDSETSMVQNTSFWQKMPSLKFDVKVNAADQEAAVSDQVGQGSMPAAKISMTQADGFISTQFVTGGKTAQKSMITELKAPIYGEMSIAQKYNYKMKATQTGALNILGDSSLPRVNVLYANIEKKIKGEWVVKKERFEYNVTAESRPGFGENGEKQFGKVGDRVSFGLATVF